MSTGDNAAPENSPTPVAPMAPVVPRRRRRARRVLAVAVGAVVLLAVAVVVVPCVLPEAMVGREVARQLNASLAREAQVEGARFSLFSGFRASGVEVRRRDGFGDGPLLRIGTLVLVPDIPELLQGRLRLLSVRIHDADLYLVRDERSVLNVDDLLVKPPREFAVASVLATDSRLHLRTPDGEHTVAITRASLGAPAEGQRPMDVRARLGTGGELALSGGLAVTPDGGEFEHGEGTLLIESLALGDLLAGPGGAPPLLANATLHANLSMQGRADRDLRVAGTLEVEGLPEVPQLGFEGDDRVAAAELSFVVSPREQHLDLTVTTHPGGAIEVKATLDPIEKGKGTPALVLDNYLLDVRAEAWGDLARHDLARGGLPGTRLVGGRARAEASLKGTFDRFVATLSATLEDAVVAVEDGAEPVPAVSLEGGGTLSLANLSAELTRLVVRAEGVSATIRGRAQPVEGALVQIAPDSALPPMAADFTVDAEAELARWSPGLRALAGLPTEGRLQGKLSVQGGAASKAGLLTVDGELRLDGFACTAPARAPDPADLAASMHVIYDPEKAAMAFSDTAVRGRGIDGSVKGAIACGRALGASALTGCLDIDLGEASRYYGVLAGLPRRTSVSGGFAWRLDARGEGDLATAHGRAALIDLVVTGPPMGRKLAIEPMVEIAHDVVWDAGARILAIRKLRAATSRGEATLTGTLALPGGSGATDLKLNLDADADAIRPFLPWPDEFGALKAAGRVVARAEAAGPPGDVKGFGTVTWTSGRMETPFARLAADLDYRIEGALGGRQLKLDGRGTLADLEWTHVRLGREPVVQDELTFSHALEGRVPDGPLVVTAAVPKLAVYSRTVEQIRLNGKLEGRVLHVDDFSCRPMGGTARAKGRIAFDPRQTHRLWFQARDVALDQDAELLGAVPFLGIVNAIVGGRPEKMDFVASAEAELRARGSTPEALRATLAGEGSLRLARFRVTGSPLFRMLAVFTSSPGLRDVTFEQVDAPFTIVGGRVETTATLPFEKGAFVISGHALRSGQTCYAIRVTNPRGIGFVAHDMVPYLEAGHPIMHISGPAQQPTCRIPTESILQFTLKRKLDKGLEALTPRPKGK